MKYILAFVIFILMAGCDSTDGCSVTSFSSATDEELWSCLQSGGPGAIIGFKNPGEEEGVVNGIVLVSDEQYEIYISAVGDVPGLLLGSRLGILPAVSVQFQSFESFVQVRRQDFVEYIEPGGIPR